MFSGLSRNAPQTRDAQDVCTVTKRAPSLRYQKIVKFTDQIFEMLDISELVPQESEVEGALNNSDSDSDDELRV